MARTLIADTDLLILDEPTNHLDIEMTEWLENYLSAANITLLMVTHDRSFLDRVCNDIFELSDGNLYHYRGKYDYFLEKKPNDLQMPQQNMRNSVNSIAKSSHGCILLRKPELPRPVPVSIILKNCKNKSTSALNQPRSFKVQSEDLVIKYWKSVTSTFPSLIRLL